MVTDAENTGKEDLVWAAIPEPPALKQQRDQPADSGSCDVFLGEIKKFI